MDKVRKNILWLALALCMSPMPLLAKDPPYKQGVQHYAKGEFEKAIQDLQRALKKKPTQAEKVKIYKYIGLSQFTLGRRAESEKNFEQCLVTDAKCSIDRKEALDESVLPFFQDIKRRLVEKKNASKPKTRILVTTPVKDAEVLLDGVLLGPANTSLDAKPGTREITLQAKGYKPRRVKIAINKLVENVYEIDLDKAPPKIEERAARADSREKARQARLAETQRKKEAKARKLEARREREREKARTPAVLPVEGEAIKKVPDPARETLAAQPTPTPPPAAPPAPPPAVAPAPAPQPPPPGLARESVSFAHFLPLGVGQFYNGDYLLGSLFLGTQFYAAGVIIVAKQDIEQAKSTEQAVFRRADVDPSVTQDELDQASADKNTVVKARNKRISIASGVLTGTYVFGVLHALFNRPYVLAAPTTAVIKPIPEPDDALRVQLLPTDEQGVRLEMNWKF